MTKKNLLKSGFLFVVAFLFLFFMYRSNILDFHLLQSSFQNHKKIMILISLLQILNCLFMALRYQTLLRIFHIKVGFFNSTAATFVSNAIGLWMPGSMAFIEVIRIALMTGANHHSNPHKLNSQSPEYSDKMKMLSLRSKLTAISLFDRFIGLFVMLVFGGVAASLVLFSKADILEKDNSQTFLLSILIVFSFLLSLFILLLPFFARSLFFRKFIGRMERIFLTLFKHGVLNKILRKIFYEIQALLDAISIGGRQIEHFLIPTLFSVFCLFFTAFGTYFCAIAISNPIPLPAVLATVSIISLASLLPIGFGGMGGVQLVAAIVMGIFSVEHKVAASAQFLQTAINLLSLSLAGLFFVKLTFRQIRAALSPPKV